MTENEKNIKTVESEKENSPEIFNRKITSRRDARALAFQILYAIDRSDYTISLEDALELFRYGFDMHIPQDCLIVYMIEGAIEQRDDLDLEIDALLKNWKIDRLGCCTLLILRLAIWELKQPEVIASVIINEAVELAKCFAEKDSYKFVNGILDEYCSKKGLSISSKESEE